MSVESCHSQMSVFSEYERESWQKINRSKSAITFSSKTPINIKEAKKTMIDINREGGVKKYLVLPDQIRRRKREFFTSVVDMIRQKDVNWFTRFLSKARKFLIAVHTYIPTYKMLCFQLSFSFCKQIQSTLTRFWWNGPNH